MNRHPTWRNDWKRPIKYKVHVFLSVVCLLLIGASPTLALELKDLIKKVKPSVVLILCQESGETVSQGSGFLLSPEGVVLTNAHVVNEAISIKILYKDKLYKANVNKLGDVDKIDLALLKIANPPMGIKTVSIAKKETDIGEDVFILSYPKAFDIGIEPTLSFGKISSKRVFSKYSFLQVSAPITHGSSGGPVFNMNGEVVGIATSGLGEADINFAIPIKYYKNFPTYNASEKTSKNNVKLDLPYNTEEIYKLKYLFSHKWYDFGLEMNRDLFRKLRTKYPDDPLFALYFAWIQVYGSRNNKTPGTQTREEIIDNLSLACQYGDFSSIIAYYRNFVVPKGTEFRADRVRMASVLFSRLTVAFQDMFPETTCGYERD